MNTSRRVKYIVRSIYYVGKRTVVNRREDIQPDIHNRPHILKSIGAKRPSRNFCKEVRLKCSASDQLSYGIATVNKDLIVSSSSTVLPPLYSVRAVLSVGRVAAVFARHSCIFMWTTVSITVWKPIWGKIFEPNVPSKIQIEFFVSDGHPYFSDKTFLSNVVIFCITAL